MQYNRILCNARYVASQLTKGKFQVPDRTNTLRCMPFINNSTTRSIHRTKISASAFNQRTSSDNIIKRIFKKFFDKQMAISAAAGFRMYEIMLDKINYAVFFKDFNMPDTFFSWFLITQLHVWMLMVRYMAEGDYGRAARNALVEAMWNDINIRSSKLGDMTVGIKRQSIQELSSQFNAAIIGYDEGLMSQDRVLAGALWRTFFKLECHNPELIEKLLIYVRKQINLLDRIPSEHIFKLSSIQFLNIKDINIPK